MDMIKRDSSTLSAGLAGGNQIYFRSLVERAAYLHMEWVKAAVPESRGFGKLRSAAGRTRGPRDTPATQEEIKEATVSPVVILVTWDAVNTFLMFMQTSQSSLLFHSFVIIIVRASAATAKMIFCKYHND